MASKSNKACTLKVGQIEKDPILALGMSEKDVEKYGRVAKAYGNVAPAIVGQRGAGYRILAGQARLEACAQNGIQEMPVIVADADGEANQMKLALMLSTVREEGGPLSEGALINALVTQHGVPRHELMALLKKSKSWISKRETLALRLSEDVKGMVRGGVISARTAEEIARLPQDVQTMFACKVARDGLNKDHAGKLVSMYTADDADMALRETILAAPLAALDAIAETGVQRRKEKRGAAERISGIVGFLIRLAFELKGLLATMDGQALNAVARDLDALRGAVADLSTVLCLRAGVSPGEPQGGGGAL